MYYLSHFYKHYEEPKKEEMEENKNFEKMKMSFV